MKDMLSSIYCHFRQVFFYTFAIIGMEIFSGLIHYYGYTQEVESNRLTAFCGNEKLEGSLFYKDHYCANNFNHIFKALVLMFELMVVNQWHDILLWKQWARVHRVVYNSS